VTVRRDAGLTLLELAAVMAIFSLVAVMALQGMTAAMGAQTRQAGEIDKLRSVAAAVTLLRRDLGAMVPVSHSGAAFRMDADGLSFVVGGQPTLPEGRRTGVARISWRVDGGRLVRGERPLEGAGSERVVLEPVDGWAVRVLGDRGGWQTGWSTDPAEARQLPRAIEVRFGGGGTPDLRVLVAR
jgi:general secretion pathway protein J